MERRERLVELDYFNAAACLMVMLIHVLSLGVTELDRGSWQAAETTSGCSCCTPCGPS